jgi:hypothetical protein
VVITLVYDAVPKREECISVLRTSDKGWRVVRLDNVVVVVNCYLSGLAVALKPVWYIVEVDLLDLVKLIHGCILVP